MAATLARTPLVSVVMAARNAGPTVAAAVNSIRAQTLNEWEFIVLDDGSQDDTAAIVAAFDDPRIRLMGSTENLGLAARLNEGIGHARGRYIARMDADDIAYPERLLCQLAYLEARPEIDLVGAQAMVFSGERGAYGVMAAAETHAAITARPAVGFRLAHPTWVGRRAWFGEDPYRETAFRAQDQDLLLRRYRTSRFANVQEILLGYRQERPRARAIMLGRWHYTRALVATGRPMLAVTGAAMQFVAATATLGMLAAGKADALVARRFRAATVGELAKWAIVQGHGGRT